MPFSFVSCVCPPNASKEPQQDCKYVILVSSLHTRVKVRCEEAIEIFQRAGASNDEPFTSTRGTSGIKLEN